MTPAESALVFKSLTMLQIQQDVVGVPGDSLPEVSPQVCERVLASLLSFHQSRQSTVSKPLPHNAHSFLAQRRDQITQKKAISPDGNAREPNEVLGFLIRAAGNRHIGIDGVNPAGR